MIYSTKERSNCQLTIIEQQLKEQVLENEDYDSNNWKTYWKRLIESQQQLEEIIETTAIFENSL